MTGSGAAAARVMILGAAMAGCSPSRLGGLAPPPLNQTDAGSPADARADARIDVPGDLAAELISVPLPQRDPSGVCPYRQLSSNDGGADGAAADAARPDDCPAAEPTAGSPCGADPQQCGYGDPLNVHCRHIWFCSGGSWVVSDSCSPGNPYPCPDQEPQTGSACTGVGKCSYPSGIFCRCDTQSWNCAMTANNCPAQVPFDGTPCDQELVDCRYLGCGGFTAACCGARWVVRSELCIIPL